MCINYFLYFSTGIIVCTGIFKLGRINDILCVVEIELHYSFIYRYPSKIYFFFITPIKIFNFFNSNNKLHIGSYNIDQHYKIYCLNYN